MANITAPTIIRVKNAANDVVVPVTRAFKFTGGLVVTQVAPAEAEVNGVGVASAWSVLGNAGAGLILGTTTDDEYNFVQNNQSRGGFQVGGEFFIKTDNVFADSGRLTQATNGLTTIGAVPASIFLLNVAQPRVGKLTASIQGRKTDGTGRCAFERTFLFWQEGMGVNISSKVQTDFTDKSDVAYDVRALTSGNDIIIQVIGKAGEVINWTGHFKYQTVE